MAQTAGAPPSPLRNPVFRALWLAGLVSNVGAWMQTVGAQWFLVDAHSPAWEIALVQTAAALPVLVLAIPGGVLGEFVNRRRVLIGVQAVQFSVSLALTVLAVADALSSASLLALTFALGACSALQLPAYQAIVPDIVDRAQITSAATLSSVGINVARAVGPAVAGVIVAQWGVAAVFAANAVSFLPLLATLVLWRSYAWHPARPERVVDATRAGIRFVLHAPVIRALYLRLAWFLVPGAALWALLPAVASDRLHLGASWYGGLLAALGAGAVAASLALPLARRRCSTSAIVAAGAVGFAVATGAMASSPPLWLAIPALCVGGAGWIAAIATVNGAVQAYLPTWVRTRALSVYQFVLYGSTALGSLLASALSAAIGIGATLAGAALALVGLAVFCARRPVARLREADLAAAPLPLTDADFTRRGDEPDDDVLVLVSYDVPPEHRSAFLGGVRDLEASRRRTGARSWHLYQDDAHADTVVEAFVVGSWDEHVSQLTERQTGSDARARAAVRATGVGEPSVQHLVRLAVPRRARGGPADTGNERPTRDDATAP